MLVSDIADTSPSLRCINYSKTEYQKQLENQRNKKVYKKPEFILIGTKRGFLIIVGKTSKNYNRI